MEKDIQTRLVKFANNSYAMLHERLNKALAQEFPEHETRVAFCVDDIGNIRFRVDDVIVETKNPLFEKE